tara:strand:- start:41 stop:424 length:384 start_codon:yes stop_codon:yes gene_type:complete
MISLKTLIMERIDFHETAKQIVKHYRLKSKVKFVAGNNKADYDWINDTINLRPSYSSVKEFLITLLHEIHHATMRWKYGADKYENLYQRAGDIAVNNGGDFHDDNPYEKEAERWGKTQYARVWKSKI